MKMIKIKKINKIKIYNQIKILIQSKINKTFKIKIYMIKYTKTQIILSKTLNIIIW